MLKFGLNLGDFLIRKNLKHMIVHVTNHCNFRCDHCFIDFSPKKDIRLEKIHKLAQSTGKLFWLDIGGGEPFLRKDLAEIVSAFDVQVVQIPSNGSLPDQMIEQLKRMRGMTKAEVAVSLSLDGLEVTHNRVRNEEDSWNQVWSTYERLKKLGGFPIKINTVITADNEHEILDLMREVRRHDPDFHSIILLRGDPMKPETKLPSLERLRELGSEIFSILETYDYAQNAVSAHILRNYHKYLWNVSLATLEAKRQVVPCLAGCSHMVVMGDGAVSSCEMLTPVGNINEQSWDKIMSSDIFKQQVADIRAGKCHCTHNCAMLDSILFNPKSFPHLLNQRVG